MMNTGKLVLALSAAMLAAGSTASGAGAPAAPGSAAPAPAFDASQFAPFKKRGAGKIDGAFALASARAGGDAQVVSGATVECYPDIAYAAWALQQAAIKMNKGADPIGAPNAANDKKLTPYIRVTKTDTDGSYHFTNLPRGRYILRASILQNFPRQIADPNALPIIGGPPVPKTGPTVFDVTHAWFDSNPVYVGDKAPAPPLFHLVARHDRYDPRR